MVLALSNDNENMIGIEEVISIDNKKEMEIRTNVEEVSNIISNQDLRKL